MMSLSDCRRTSAAGGGGAEQQHHNSMGAANVRLRRSTSLQPLSLAAAEVAATAASATTTTVDPHSGGGLFSLLLIHPTSMGSSSRVGKDPVSRLRWICKPQRWSLVCLLLLILSLASTCSVLMHYVLLGWHGSDPAMTRSSPWQIQGHNAAEPSPSSLAYWLLRSGSDAVEVASIASSMKRNYSWVPPPPLSSSTIAFVRRQQPRTSAVAANIRVNPPRVTYLAALPDRSSAAEGSSSPLLWSKERQFYNPNRILSSSTYNHMDNNNDVVLWDSEALYYVNGATTAAAANGSDVTSSSSSSDFTTERTDGCLPMSEWQVKSFPNCNSFHETDFGRSVRDGELSVLGRGWFRTTWQYGPPGAPIPLVLKTLRMEREFLPEYYELHRRDATAMERLTWSEFVVDIYGYCAQSVVNEMADFPSPDVRDLEKLNRRLRRKKGPEIDKIKLQLAASVAQGVTDIHSIDGPGRATMVHYDLNPRNIALFSGARPKINDFNIAEFLTYDPATNATCGFENRMHQPWWRAPEEVDPNRTVLLDEKVDAYALCNILFSIYTTHAPRGKMKDYRMEGVRELVAAGIPPDLPPPYNETKTSITDVFTKIFSRCYAKDPKERASSQEITDILVNAIYDRIQKSQGKKGGSGKKKEPSLTNLKKEPEAAASNPDAEAVAADVVAEASPSDDDSSDTTEDAKERTR